ncbi:MULTISPECIES: C40 family peptidase [unclassified Campylobacter]|uniref:C40 family peptidase n=1 Tax=unclassified Campylobacter TaxID=2593542 RepID=UPI001237E174|nr:MULTISPECIES: NlpC/P60 family protein [unclassified Campylobacter]KAA6225095.1 NlpC/P60 family protein [Campylobacter sp. LR196d]KAA6226109.1 NlpC/P60 family protein [Campylobacter sp. LR185c]KAA6228056.1 NlpC/P60 family protein [Campylobacter sp. LR286c]KAA6231309.1 NlpC/P60 family protein [Campylobacter sp. LR264d]KAA6231521.1 NlpC/P60 family protein [Campylobacter sp. LR291e]
MKHYVLVILLGFFISGCSFYQNSSTDATQSLLESRIKNIASGWKKTPYVLGGKTKKGSDCSGFTQSVFAEFNTAIPRNTTMQYQAGSKVSKQNLQTGDLVFFRTGRGPNGMHVGIYLSDFKFVHLSTKGGVKEVSLNSDYWKKRYIGARRVNFKSYVAKR